MFSILVHAAVAAPADRVFLLVMDGARAFEMADVAFKYCPTLQSTYIPSGTLVRTLENRDLTSTDGAHREITTSRRQPTASLPWDDFNDLTGAMSPTIFEEYAASVGAAGSVGFLIGNSVFMDSQGSSVYPGMQGYGAPELADHDIQDRDDGFVRGVLTDYLSKNPGTRVVLWNIHQADKDGHDGDFAAYTASLADADEAIDRFVREQASANDAYFVLADHGRHDEPTKWANHGDACAGCRPSFLVAWGRGVQRGVEIDTAYELADVAVTAAWAAGVDMSAARGRPIVELLTDPPAAPDDEHSLVDPDVTVDGAGTVHLVASRLSWAGAGGALMHRTGDGTTFGAWSEVPLPLGVQQPEEPRLAVTGGTAVLTFRAYDTALRDWSVYASTWDGGWSEPELVEAAVLHHTVPRMVPLTDGTLQGAWWSLTTDRTDEPPAFSYVSGSVGSTSSWSQATTATNEDVRIPMECQLYVRSKETSAICSGLLYKNYPQGKPGDFGEKGKGDVQNREIFRVDGLAAGAPVTTPLWENNSVSFWPSLADDGTTLHLAWSERPEPIDAGGWSTWYASSTDGVTWSAPVQVDDGGAEAWRPQVAVVGGRVVVGYTEIEGADHRVVLAEVVGGAVAARRVVAEEAGVVDRVALTAVGEEVLLAWNLSLGITDDTVHTALVNLDEDPDTGDPDDTGETDTTGETDETDGGESETGNAKDVRTCCGVQDPVHALGWLVVAGAVAMRRRSEAPRRTHKEG